MAVDLMYIKPEEASMADVQVTTPRIAAQARGRTLLVVTHGGVLDSLYRAATGVGLEAQRTWQLGNAAINRVLFTGERFTLVGWSDTAHLEDGTLDDASEGDCPTVPRAAE